MKNINNILTRGSAKQRVLLYFENLFIESIDKRPGVKGFLTKEEQQRLRNSFKKKDEMILFHKYYNAYDASIVAIGKLAVLHLEFVALAASLPLLYAIHQDHRQLLETINRVYCELITNLKVEKYECESINTTLAFSSLIQSEDGFFDIEYTDDMEIISKRKSYREEAIKSLIKVKSAINAIEEYLSEMEFDIEAYNNFLKDTAEDCNKRAQIARSNIFYHEIEIDKDYSIEFRNYFVF
ncbi:hypothetical protein [Emticicia sp. C21]|uniref:hypothetical protein n=1 Tax=Emticicia sp. C21 TaxID=2302915 RepID=UPI000E356CA0|nr:hypothetical protein [Emticicia sp. C21]RFS17357.1 hypothetical protein D0T08_06145 [Emticicia sp. C21]